MKTIAIFKKDLDDLPDWTESYSHDAKVGAKYKIRSIFRGQIIYDVGEKLSDGSSILKTAVIVDEFFISNES